MKLDYRGRTIYIDDEDYERFSKYRWQFHDREYMHCLRLRKRIILHRMLLDLPPFKEFPYQVDHINRNPLDNRKSNLRVCTPSQNQANVGVTIRNKSGHRGISWDRRWRKWKAQISINKKRRTLGFFKDKEEAIKAYNEGAKEAWGDFIHKSSTS